MVPSKEAQAGHAINLCDEPEWKIRVFLMRKESILKHSRWEASADPVGGDEALALYTEAIELEPSDVNVLASAYANRSLALGELGRLDEALDDSMRAIELEPTDVNVLPKAYAVRALAQAALGRTAEAEADLAEAIELGLMEACDFGT